MDSFANDLGRIERDYLDPEYDAYEQRERLQDIADERALRRWEESRDER